MNQLGINKKVLWVFSAVCMELIALGMIIPLSPYMARSFGADDLQVGLLMSIYSIVQMVCSPFLGRWSDFLGRRPILLMSILCTSLSYVWFAFAPSLTHLFLSRAFAGLAGVTVSTSFAFVSDLTDKKNRSKNMALIGAAFGIGFVIGPALGGVIGYQESLSTVALGASLMCLIGLAIIWFKVKESHPQTRKESQSKKNYFFSSKIFKNSSLRNVLFLFFILSLSLTLVEAPLFLLMKDRFQWSQSLSSWGFAYIGFILALTQGGIVRYLIPILGEKILSYWGFVALFLGLFLVISPSLFVVGIAVTLFSLGFGLAYTCLTGVISLLSQKDQQGGVLGVHQSLSSLSRIVGPALGGWLYRDTGGGTPFIVAGSLAFLGLGLSFLFRKDMIVSSKFSLKKQVSSDSIFSSQRSEDLEVTFFQINNLIQQQIPFSFINLSSRISSNQNSKKENHFPLSMECLLSYTTDMTEEELLNHSFQNPVVLICEDGKLSQNLVLKLSAKVSNCFYFKGGWNQYQKECQTK